MFREGAAPLTLDHSESRVRFFHTGGRFTIGGRMYATAKALDAPALGGDHLPPPGRYCLNYVIEGSGTYTDQSGSVYEIGPRTAFQRIPGRWHTTVIEPRDYVECYFHLSATLYQALRSIGVISEGLPVVPVVRPERALQAASRLFDALDPHWAGGWHEALGRLIALLAATTEASPAAETVPDRIEEVRKFIVDNADRRVTVGQMASRAGMSPSTLSREFKHRLGCSPGRFLIRCRIDRACRLLRTNSVTSVAYRLGYPDPKAFSKQFSRYVGMCPSRFQQQELGR